jgi:hypothetical protein
MKRSLFLAACAAIVIGVGSAASADPWKDESGKGRWRGEYRDDDRGSYARDRREYKQEFRYNGCKVERKWERNGGYKEEIKCDGRRREAPQLTRPFAARLAEQNAQPLGLLGHARPGPRHH